MKHLGLMPSCVVTSEMERRSFASWNEVSANLTAGCGACSQQACARRNRSRTRTRSSFVRAACNCSRKSQAAVPKMQERSTTWFANSAAGIGRKRRAPPGLKQILRVVIMVVVSMTEMVLTRESGECPLLQVYLLHFLG